MALARKARSRLARERWLLGTWAVAIALTAVFVAHPVPGVDERVLVADLRGRALIVLDPTDPRRARRIPLPGGPHELLRLPDGRVAVSLEQSGTVAVVDLGDGAVETHAVGGLPHGLWLDGATLFVTDRSAGAVRRFALDTWAEGPATPAPGWPHALARLADGRLVVAAAEADALLLGERVIAVSAGPETLAVSPDGSRIATAGSVGGAVEVFAADGRRLALYAVGGRPVRVAWSAAGVLAAALAAAREVALIGADGSVRRVTVAGTPDGLAFSADGRRLYASDTYSGQVTAIDVARGSVVAVLDVGEATGALYVLGPR